MVLKQRRDSLAIGRLKRALIDQAEVMRDQKMAEYAIYIAAEMFESVSNFDELVFSSLLVETEEH